MIRCIRRYGTRWHNGFLSCRESFRFCKIDLIVNMFVQNWYCCSQLSAYDGFYSQLFYIYCNRGGPWAKPSTCVSHWRIAYFDKHFNGFHIHNSGTSTHRTLSNYTKTISLHDFNLLCTNSEPGSRPYSTKNTNLNQGARIATTTDYSLVINQTFGATLCFLYIDRDSAKTPTNGNESGKEYANAAGFYSPSWGRRNCIFSHSPTALLSVSSRHFLHTRATSLSSWWTLAFWEILAFHFTCFSAVTCCSTAFAKFRDPALNFACPTWSFLWFLFLRIIINTST